VSRARQKLGKEGEGSAVEFLEGLGWRILERRWRCRFGELDIIALDDRTLVFVEVKTRSSERFGAPEEAVGAAKRERLARCALSYVRARAVGDRPLRFDVISILGGKIRRIEDAFGIEGYTR